MKKIITLLFLVNLTAACKDRPEIQANDNPKETTLNEHESTAAPLVFPQDYVGDYKGDLNIISSNGTEIIPMTFTLASTKLKDKYDYQITYGDQETRNYTLITTANSNVYELDENNGIKIPTAFSNNTLHSTYEVAGNLLNSTMIFSDTQVNFMINMSKLNEKEITGEAAGYEVSAYPLFVMQHANLIKQ